MSQETREDRMFDLADRKRNKLCLLLSLKLAHQAGEILPEME